MPARLGKRKTCTQACASKLPTPPLPSTDAQWILLALALGLATCIAVAPSSYFVAELVFVPPSRADLMLPARSATKHLDRQYRRDVLDRVAKKAPAHCGVGASARSALFAHNFVLRDAGGDESVVDANVVHFCGNPGEFETSETCEVTAAELRH